MKFRISFLFTTLLYSSIFLIILCLQSCEVKNKKNEDLSFYYWKTNYALNGFETEYLRKQQVKKIYLRCFDVVWENNTASPQGVLMWQDKPIDNIQYIPTVFIRNEVFLDTDSVTLKRLADKIESLCTQVLGSHKLQLSEIQIDCDWTKTTRNAYFYFLAYLKQKKLVVSNTLRLYQYKYRDESGIAPTDYASLMCYNMGNIKEEDAENSILNKRDLASYLNGLSAYPQPLNIALPLFSWTLLYSNHSLKGILYKTPDLQNNHWSRISDVQYLCTQDYYDLNCGQEFYKNEKLRIEQITPQALKEAFLIIKKYVKNSKNELIYFDLDSSKIRNTLH